MVRLALRKRNEVFKDTIFGKPFSGLFALIVNVRLLNWLFKAWLNRPFHAIILNGINLIVYILITTLIEHEEVKKLHSLVHHDDHSLRGEKEVLKNISKCPNKCPISKFMTLPSEKIRREPDDDDDRQSRRRAISSLRLTWA